MSLRNTLRNKIEVEKELQLNARFLRMAFRAKIISHEANTNLGHVELLLPPDDQDLEFIVSIDQDFTVERGRVTLHPDWRIRVETPVRDLHMSRRTVGTIVDAMQLAQSMLRRLRRQHRDTRHRLYVTQCSRCRSFNGKAVSQCEHCHQKTSCTECESGHAHFEHDPDECNQWREHVRSKPRRTE